MDEQQIVGVDSMTVKDVKKALRQKGVVLQAEVKISEDDVVVVPVSKSALLKILSQMDDDMPTSCFQVGDILYAG